MNTTKHSVVKTKNQKKSKNYPLLAVVGGTFDPPHLAHLALLSSIQQFGVDRIHVMPCQRNALKQNNALAAAHHRVQMLRLMCEALSFPVIIDTQEIERPGPSYIINSLKQIKKDFPEWGIVLVSGMDSFLSLPKWYCFEKIQKMTHFFVVSRPGYVLPERGGFANWCRVHETKEFNELRKSKSGCIFMHSYLDNPIKASVIREKINRNQNVDNELRQSVMQYIKTHQLYRDKFSSP